MRSYIRHPSDIPVEIIAEKGPSCASVPRLINFSHGGLSFLSRIPHPQNSLVKIRISFVNPPFETVGTIKWCQPKDRQFEIGIEFLDQNDQFKMRMVEQICHIEHYKNEVLLKEGRKLTGHEAAMEWIEKYAGDFPGSDDDQAVNH